MKLFKSLLVLTAIVAGAATAEAKEMTTAYPYQCAITFTAKGGGLQVVVGEFTLKGTGNIRCADASGATLVIPVNVTLGGKSVAARVAAGYLEVAGTATGVGYLTGPAALMGTYALVGAQAAVVVGAGAQFTAHSSTSNVSLGLNLQASRGFGLNVGYANLVVTPR
jgi:hypothetical protein